MDGKQLEETGQGEKSEEESKGSTITAESAEESLASLRKTIAALDDFETRWKVS